MKAKKRKKALPSSWRVKKRYLAFRATSARAPLDSARVRSQVEYAVERAFGSLGSAAFRVQFLRFDESTRQGILRCKREHLNAVASALAFSSESEPDGVRIQAIAASGSIRGLLTAEKK